MTYSSDASAAITRPAPTFIASPRASSPHDQAAYSANVIGSTSNAAATTRIDSTLGDRSPAASPCSQPTEYPVRSCSSLNVTSLSRMSALTDGANELDAMRAMSGTLHRDPDLIHVVTDGDDDRALCGLDVSGHEWMPRGGGRGPRCVVCESLNGATA